MIGRLLPVLAFFLLCGTSVAEEPAAKAGSGPARLANDAAAVAPVPSRPDVQTQRVPFLGTATVQATPEQRRVADLPEGTGLTVQHVLEGSPADTAGIRRGDVLHKLGDQILVNDPQFRVLLRMHVPGDEIELTLRRDTGSTTVGVRLGEKVVPVEPVPANELLRWLLQPAPPENATVAAADFSATYEDESHTLLLRSGPTGKHLTARDRQGNVIFEGDVDTPQQRAAVPEPLRTKLKQMETPPGTVPATPAEAGPPRPAKEEHRVNEESTR